MLKLRRKSVRKWNRLWSGNSGVRTRTAIIAVIIGIAAAVAAAILHDLVALLDRYSHYLYLSSARDVCVMVDDAWKPPKDAAKNAMWKADIVKASKDLRLLLGYEYVLKLRQYWVDRWSGAQLTAAIMSQLLRIDWNGSITKYSEDVTSRLVSTFGSGYLDDTFVDIPDLLGSPEPITLHDFPRADKQITVDELQEVTA